MSSALARGNLLFSQAESQAAKAELCCLFSRWFVDYPDIKYRYEMAGLIFKQHFKHKQAIVAYERALEISYIACDPPKLRAIVRGDLAHAYGLRDREMAAITFADKAKDHMEYGAYPEAYQACISAADYIQTIDTSKCIAYLLDALDCLLCYVNDKDYETFQQKMILMTFRRQSPLLAKVWKDIGDRCLLKLPKYAPRAYTYSVLCDLLGRPNELQAIEQQLLDIGASCTLFAHSSDYHQLMELLKACQDKDNVEGLNRAIAMCEFQYPESELLRKIKRAYLVVA